MHSWWVASQKHVNIVTGSYHMNLCCLNDAPVVDQKALWWGVKRVGLSLQWEGYSQWHLWLKEAQVGEWKARLLVCQFKWCWRLGFGVLPWLAEASDRASPRGLLERSGPGREMPDPLAESKSRHNAGSGWKGNLLIIIKQNRQNKSTAALDCDIPPFQQTQFRCWLRTGVVSLCSFFALRWVSILWWFQTGINTLLV